jgi:hypothetical protein
MPGALRLVLLPLCAAALLSACGGGGGGHIQISPVDPRFVAVARAAKGRSPRHQGVLLARDKSVPAAYTPVAGTGSNRIHLDASGLTQQAEARLRTVGFDWDLDLCDNTRMVGNQALDTQTLASNRRVPGAAYHGVRVRSNSRPGCFGASFRQFVDADAASFNALGEVRTRVTSATPGIRLVSGAPGQVAASAPRAASICFVDSALLP